MREERALIASLYGKGESVAKGELIRQIYWWPADRGPAEIGEYEERTRFRKALANLWHRKLATPRANREPSSGFLALVIYDNYTPLPTVWRVCPPLLLISWPPNACWPSSPCKAGLNDSRNRAGLREEAAPRCLLSYLFLFLPISSPSDLLIRLSFRHLVVSIVTCSVSRLDVSGWKMEYLDWTFPFICCFLILLDDRWWTLEKLFHSISSSNFDYFYQYFDILSDTLSEIFARCFGRLYFWKLYKKIQCYIIQGKKFFLVSIQRIYTGILKRNEIFEDEFW